MNNYKFKHGDMEAWLIVVAINGQHDLIDKMKMNEDGSYPVVFSVGGVELDFSTVAKRIDESVNMLVEDKAKELLNNKYGKLIKEIEEIQDKLEEQKGKIFRYDYES